MLEFAVDRYPEVNKPLSARYVKSFAYPTFKERIPGILLGIVEQLKNEDEIQRKYGPAAVAEADEVAAKILNLKNNMQSNAPLTEIGSMAYEVSIYNKLINEKTEENDGNPPTWFQTEWLFAECYLYFKLHEIFYFSKTLKKFDPFMKSKVESLLASESAIILLCKFLCEVKSRGVLTREEKKEFFTFFVNCSLWGNKADLSLSGGKAVSASKETFDEMQGMGTHILVNDMDDVYELINKESGYVIDIVLDNAGYELFNDLCFADFLVWSGIASKIVFHGKIIPWFVSDVTPLDFWLQFDLLKEFDSEVITCHVNDWQKYVEEGKFVLKSEPFWILPYDNSRMKAEAPDLYSELSQNKLVIFKGDLNYRKLVGDIYWEPTTSFKNALRGFGPTNVLSLRTVKSDTVCGLQPGLFESLSKKEPSWLITGNYGLIQLAKI